MSKNTMEAAHFLNTDALDIIFLNRNKAYGAYELRKNYPKRIKKTLAIIVFVTLLGASVPILASFSEEEKIKAPMIIEYQIHDVRAMPKEVNRLQSKPKEPSLKSSADVLKHTTPEIVPNEVVSDDLMHEAKNLSKANLGNTNKAGEDTNLTDERGSSVPTPTNFGTAPIDKPEEDFNTVFDAIDVEQLPEFPGGEDELMIFLNKNMKYPERAVKENAQGKVVVTFIVNTNGEIENLKITRSLGFGCDDEALRVVKAMPKWKPGRFNGHNVSVQYDLPIQFELTED